MSWWPCNSWMRRASKPAGVVVQWNCHPETLDSKNTHISADFVGYTVQELNERYRCPVVYLTGTVGGLMTSLQVAIKDEKGQPLADGTFEKTERYGRLVGRLAASALEGREGGAADSLAASAASCSCRWRTSSICWPGSWAS